MRTNRLAIFTLAAATAAAASVANAADLRPLLDAIRQVESGGRTGRIVGDNGRSLGPMQISRAYHKDSGVPGRYEQVNGRAYSERVMRGYWAHHCPRELARGNYEALARCHNAGPGWRGKMRKTDGYWRKVRRAMR
jgi:hypothetical protein